MRGRGAVFLALAVSFLAGSWTAPAIGSGSGSGSGSQFARAASKNSTSKSKSKSKSKKTKAKPNDFDPRLPILGTRLAEFPAGAGKASADRGCVFCHSPDIVTQQHLTGKQWAAEVVKMTSWGADVPADKREELVAYLAKNFGPDAPRFEPVTTRPVGK